MTGQTLDNMHAVFGKTQRGREELNQRGKGLNARQRSILILMDGARSLQMLTAIISPPELKETVPYLLKQGFIARPTAATAEVLTAEARPAPDNLGHADNPDEGTVPAVRLTQDAAKVRQVQDFMVTTTQTYLGLLGADVIKRIERAKNAEQLMAVVGHWHMALHDSRQGSRFAAPYLEQVKTSLSETPE